MRRRKYLKLGGAAMATAVAGCSSNEEEDPGEEASPTDVTATRTATATPGDGGGETDDDNTPQPTAVPTATPTDSPSPTSTASPTPTATATPEPTATPVSDGEQYSYNGNSDSVTDAFAIEGGLTTFDMDHSGDSNFQVELINTSDGDTQNFLANEIGSWEGLLPYYVPGEDYVLDVTADGNWEIIVRQPRHTIADATAPSVSGEDEFPNYLGPIQFEGFHTVRGDYDGGSNFTVSVLDDTGRLVDLCFNEIGEFEGETTTNYSGLGYIRVEATGPWRVGVE